MSAISTGGRKEAYQREGHNRFTIRELLAPFAQTAYLCRIEYLPPFVVHGTHQMKPSEILVHAERYRDLITALRDDRVENLDMDLGPVLGYLLAGIIIGLELSPRLLWRMRLSLLGIGGLQVGTSTRSSFDLVKGMEARGEVHHRLGGQPLHHTRAVAAGQEGARRRSTMARASCRRGNHHAHRRCAHRLASAVAGREEPPAPPALRARLRVQVRDYALIIPTRGFSREWNFRL